MEIDLDWRVVVADDHPLVRRAIIEAICGENVRVVAEVASGEAVLEAVLQHRPDLLILDIRMPGMPVDLAAREAHRQFPQLRVLVVTAHDDEVFLHRMSRIPLKGFLLKDEAPEELCRAVRVILQGGRWFSHSIEVRMRDFEFSAKATQDRDLTDMERNVLELLARGWANARIGRHLSLTRQTVRNYTSLLYRKIGASSRAEAAVWALRPSSLSPGAPVMAVAGGTYSS